MYFLMGLSKANLVPRAFPLVRATGGKRPFCLWFIANFRENLSKLVETLQTSVNED